MREIKNKNAFGIFGYSFLIENEDKLIGAKVNGVLPNPTSISSGQYPISRSLFFYIKNSHAKDVPAIAKYVDLFMKEDMIGKEGVFAYPSWYIVVVGS